MTNRICIVENCGRPYRAKGLCTGHYQQIAKGAHVAPLKQVRTGWPKANSREEYIWTRVEKTQDCWAWRGTTVNGGYGQVKFQGKLSLAHREIFELTNGPIPEGGVIDHLCHNPNCVNPAHLRLATHTQNMQNRKGASRHSKSGIRGVQWSTSAKYWMAVVSADGKLYRRGGFKTPEAAEVVAKALRRELHG